MISLRRAGYILTIAFTFRFTNWVFSMPHASATELTKVDILNCMGVGMAALAVAAVFRGNARIRFAVIAGAAIAAASPLMANLDWSGTPKLLQEYLVPGPGRGRFPFFPNVAYIAFGQAIGAVVKRTVEERLDRLMQWSMLIGFSMIFIGQYFSNLPYSLYANASFWTDSPALVTIRVGICLMTLAGAYLWTEYCAGSGWSWMQAMGKNSLMVYWVHVMIVYGSLVRPLKRALSVEQSALATIIVTLMMVLLSALWLEWKSRRQGQASAGGDTAGPLVKTDVAQQVGQFNRAVRLADIEPGLEAAESPERGVLAIGGGDDDLQVRPQPAQFLQYLAAGHPRQGQV